MLDRGILCCRIFGCIWYGVLLSMGFDGFCMVVCPLALFYLETLQRLYRSEKTFSIFQLQKGVFDS